MKKLILILLALVLLLSTAACGKEETGKEEVTPEVKTEEVKDLPKLDSLTVDDGYGIDFKPEVRDYVVTIPAGRPRVPKISAAGSGEIRIYQATIADTASSGTAKVFVTENGLTGEYSVRFVRDEAAGFQLQYADEYFYIPNLTLNPGEFYVFESSAPETVSVQPDGTLKAEALSEEPVTVSVLVNGEVKKQLVIDKVIPAPLDLFLIIGQSNAFGWYDVPAGYATFDDFANEQKKLSDNPRPGTVWCDDISTGYDDCWFTGSYDLSRGRKGFSPALGKEWYALTGEKSFMLQTAIGSTPVEAWTPDPNLQFYGIDCYGVTVERGKEVIAELSKAGSGFELNRVYAFWLQGESGQEYVYKPQTYTWEYKNQTPNYSYIGDWVTPSAADPILTTDAYYSYFMQMVDGLTKELGVEFFGIIPVRAMLSVSSASNKETQQLVDLVPTRAAQYALNYAGNDSIAFITRVSELARTESYPDSTAEGWGYIGVNNIHFNQVGYNAIGKDVADNTFARFSGTQSHTAETLQVLDADGATVLADGTELILAAGTPHQISGIVLPVYADQTALTFTVKDPSVCTVDPYGLISSQPGAVGQSTELTVSNGTLSCTLRLSFR